MPDTRQTTALAVEPYKLSEIFAIIPEYDGNQIFLNTFISACNTAYNMAVDTQQALVILHIKNKLRGRAAELVNSRNPTEWIGIRTLLESHFGDPRNLSALIQDLQRMRQIATESPLTFCARLETHHSKMLAAINKQNLTAKEKQAQIDLVDSMALNSLLTGLEHKIAQIVRASDPVDIVTAVSRIKRELQLSQLENQKFSSPNKIPPPPTRKPNPFAFPKQCSFCKRMGHNLNECQMRNRPPQHNQFQQNYASRPTNFPSSSAPNSGQFNNFHGQSFQQNNPQQPRPSVSKPNSNQFQPRQNPNFFRQQHQRTHHINNSDYDDYYKNGPCSYDYQYDYHINNTYDSTQGLPQVEEFQDQNSYYHYPDLALSQDPSHYENNCEDSYQNFQSPPSQSKPPDEELSTLQSQIQTLNLDSFNPNLNFPEQNFL